MVSAERAPRRAGKQFGRYHLLELIASGGMGEVYRARLAGVEGFNKNVALKRIYPHLSSDESYRKLFIQEAKVVAQLSHPNIVQVLELGAHDDDLFIAMEFVDGVDVGKLINELERHDARLLSGLAAVVAFDVLEALDYAHNKHDRDGRHLGLVHQDVSPQNILIDPESGLAKLCDFGVMRLSNETQVASMRGKLAYMAPEQARCEPIDGRADVFALGAVMYRMFTGRYLVETEDEASRLELCRKGQWGDVRDALVRVDPTIAAIVAKALQAEPSERYQSANAMRTDIEAYLVDADPRTLRSRLKAHAASLAMARGPREASDAAMDATGRDSEATQGWERVLSKARAARDPVGAHSRKPNRQRGVAPALIFGLAAAITVAVGAVLVWPSLSPLPEPPPPVSAMVDTAPESVPAVSVSETVPGEPGKTAPAPDHPTGHRSEARRGGDSGVLNLNAIPWAYVTIDGKRLARSTPLVDYKLAAGDYVIALEGPQHTKTIKLRVRPGTTVTRVVDLRSP